MAVSQLDLYKTKAKLLQKAKKKNGVAILLKQAFDIIAETAGYASWRHLKSSVKASDMFCPPGTSAYWKNWYATYEEALAHLPKGDFYLLPYHKHFFLCDGHYIRALGADPVSAEVQAVGRDWIKPQDMQAWHKIMQMIKEHDKLRESTM